MLSRIQVERPEDVEAQERQRRAAEAERMDYQHAEASAMGGGEPQAAQPAAPEKVATFVRDEPKVGRNEPCPCGSGRKYKQCHGKVA